MIGSSTKTPETNVHGATIKPINPNRLPYAEALKRRPKGACYCDLGDAACYRQGHWEARDN